MLSIIVAFDQQQGIGKDNQMPWHYPADLRYFRKVSEGKTVVMGRKTLESIGKTLPKRTNIVFSRDLTLATQFPNIQIETDPTAFFEKHQHTAEEIFVIGGSMIYQLALPYVSKLYITHIAETYPADTYFPTIAWDRFINISEETNGKLTWAVYQRK